MCKSPRDADGLTEQPLRHRMENLSLSAMTLSMNASRFYPVHHTGFFRVHPMTEWHKGSVCAPQNWENQTMLVEDLDAILDYGLTRRPRCVVKFRDPQQWIPDVTTFLAKERRMHLQAVRTKGWDLVEHYGGGDCFYRCLANAAGYPPARHSSFRAKVIDFGRANMSLFAPLLQSVICDAEAELTLSDYHSYLDTQCREGVAVGHFEVVLAATCFSLDIRMWSPRKSDGQLNVTDRGAIPFFNQPSGIVNLLHWVRMGHMDLLVTKGSSTYPSTTLPSFAPDLSATTQSFGTNVCTQQVRIDHAWPSCAN